MTDRQPTLGVHENYAANLMDEPETCPVCDKQLRPDDWCASDIELGICHADCLKGSPVVDLETGTPIDGEAHTFQYQEATSPAPQSHSSLPALRKIAAMKLTSEIGGDLVANDIEGTHDAMILEARAALDGSPAPVSHLRGADE